MSASGRPFAIVGFMLLLAALDFVGTVLAKEWTVHRSPWMLTAGAAAFLTLFIVLVCGLRYAEMSILTLGWIVTLQLAVVMVDRARYGTHLSLGGWIALLGILVLQGYLLLGGATVSDDAGGTAPGQPSAASAAS